MIRKPLRVENFSITRARKQKEEERNVVEGRRKQIRGGRAKERRRDEGKNFSDTFKGQHWWPIFLPKRGVTY